MVQSLIEKSLAALSFVLVATPLLAQTIVAPDAQEHLRSHGNWSVGASFALSATHHTGGRSLFYNGNKDIVIVESLQSGTGIGYFLGTVLHYDVSPFVGIDTRLGYTRLPGAFKTTRAWFAPCNCPADDSEMVDSTAIQYDLVSADLLISAVLLHLTPRASFSAAAGLSAGAVVFAHQTSTKLGTLDDGRGRVANERPDGTPPVRFALRGGILADVQFDHFLVRPGLYYDFGLTGVAADQAWKVNAALLQIDLLITL